MQDFQIEKNEAGQRLDKYLQKLLKNAPSSFCYKMLRKKNITLNGKKATGSEQLALNDQVQCFFSDETFEKFAGFAYNNEKRSTNQAIDKEKTAVSGKASFDALYEKAYQNLKEIEVIYEDEDVLILYKPANVLSQQANSKDLSANEWLIGYLLEKGVITKESLRTFKPSVVNRLDRNTTGLLICGKSLLGSQKMSGCVRDRSLEKYYLTVVAGTFPKELEFEGYLYKNETTNQVTIYASKEEIPQKYRKDSDPIKTGFKPLAYEKNFTLLEIHLYTGKTHQIRAHLSFLGYPILGDPKYGSKKLNEANHINNQLLHAYKLIVPKLKGMEISGKEIICYPKEKWPVKMPS